MPVLARDRDRGKRRRSRRYVEHPQGAISCQGGQMRRQSHALVRHAGCAHATDATTSGYGAEAQEPDLGSGGKASKISATTASARRLKLVRTLRVPMPRHTSWRSRASATSRTSVPSSYG